MESQKVFSEPATRLFPIPAVLVSCCTPDRTKCNIITIAWTGIVSSDPPMVSISVRRSRYSFPMLMQTREFVVNIPTEDQAWEVDWCGVKSGRDHDKFAECNFTAISAAKVRVPLIAECPVNLECRVARLIDDLSTSHVIFIGEIVSVDIDKEFYDFTDSGSTLASRIKPLVYCNGNYYKLGKLIGRPGFSVRRR